ncbi:MAG: ribosome-associated translation inhibitor RaiA [Anaerolineae bacterium]
MDVSIFTRNMEMTSHLNNYVDQKVDKLDRYLPSIDEARMDLTVEKTRSAAHSQVAQLTVRVRGKILRAEERTQDMFASIDAVMDKMYRQIARYKGKRQDRMHMTAAELPVIEAVEETVGEIVRVKRFDVLPMVPEEAVEQMELLGHSFYIFLNADENAINVVYKRGDDNYGLLQPEFV